MYFYEVILCRKLSLEIVLGYAQLRFLVLILILISLIKNCKFDIVFDTNLKNIYVFKNIFCLKLKLVRLVNFQNLSNKIWINIGNCFFFNLFIFCKNLKLFTLNICYFGFKFNVLHFWKIIQISSKNYQKLNMKEN